LHTSVAVRQNRHLVVSYSCYRVSDCSQPNFEQLLPLCSIVNANASPNRAERVKADLKNIMLRRSCLVWYSMYYMRVEECPWSYFGGRAAGGEPDDACVAEATVARSRDGLSVYPPALFGAANYLEFRRILLSISIKT